MLDEYGLRLLAEIGVDVYLPRATDGRSDAAIDSRTGPIAPGTVVGLGTQCRNHGRQS